MIGVDLQHGVFYHDHELKDHLADEKPYGQWVKGITHLEDQVAKRTFEPIMVLNVTISSAARSCSASPWRTWS